MLLCLPLISACGGNDKARLTVNLPDRFDGKEIELISFEDSVIIASEKLDGGNAIFETVENDSLKFPILVQLVIDGRVRGYYVMESGEAVLDSTRTVSGTPTNNKLQLLLNRMDSIDSTGDMVGYINLAEELYNKNKDNILGTYFGIEWLKYANPLKVDSLLANAPQSMKESRRASYYINFARLRAATAPGKPYADFEGEDIDGRRLKFSEYIEPGKYTLVDFMASWCPWCVKDLPRLKEIKETYPVNEFEIVSVAVRDKPEDTATAVGRHGINWKMVYNTQKVPYDLYGFSGIPHYMLIGPDGKIVARGESLATIENSIKEKLNYGGEE